MSVFAQDLTPRAYWPAPRGTKLLVFGYANQSGDVVTDPTLPITGVDSKIHSGIIAYQQTVNMLGRTSNFQLELPYLDGKTSGFAFGQSARRDVQGIGDISAVLSINFLGAPSMNGEEFQELRQNPRPILGASIKIVAPTGEYEADKLINVGSNRWAVRARLGYTQPLSAKWLMEVAVGAWLFEDNDEFLGETRTQEPIAAIDFSLIRRFRAGFWGSLDLNHYRGGRTTVSGIAGADLQRNSRAGITLVYPIKSRHAIKLSVSNGVATGSGGDYRIASLSYLRLIN